MFGRNGVREHVLMFSNRYLLYYMGQSARPDWQAVGYYGFLFALRRYLKPRYRKNRMLIIVPACITVAFVALVVVLRETATVHVALTAAYTLIMFAILYRATYATTLE